jgi:flagellar motility protein MotE (MotC chaperone)
MAKPAGARGSQNAVVPTGKTTSAGKATSKAQEQAVILDEPEEEIVVDAKPRTKERRRGTRRTATADRSDIPDRKIAWSADRYAAVVPPGLTLAALRSQLAKAQPATPGGAGGSATEDSQGGTLADIEKAREALRQETARLEALLKANGGCSGGVGIGMPIGDGLSAAPLSAVALREAPAEQIDAVSKAMKGMKPEQAAAVVARLDRGLAAEIIRRMKSTDAGAILGLLKPELAAELATQIATHKSLYGKEKKGSGR